MKHAATSNGLAWAICIALSGGIFQSPVDVLANQADASGASSPANDIAPYIVTFQESGLLHYQGGAQGIAATAALPTARASKFDVHKPEAVLYAHYLQAKREEHIASIERALGRSLNVTHSYGITRSGIATSMSASEATRVATLPGVESVIPAGVELPATFRGPKFIGSDSIWNGTATPSAIPTRGEGVVVADLDGGTNSDHPSFANDPACGFSEQKPKLKAVDCSTSAAGLCNGPNPEADPTFGHGVHTASTAAGNMIDNMVDPPPALPDGITMSGVAPCATLYQYKVCEGAGCGGAAVLAGIENAIADQVDVLNFSISGGTSPWADTDRDFLDAVNAGVFVAAAAGNMAAGVASPSGKVNHLGPWLTTVAASSQDEVLSPVLQVAGPGTPPVTLTAVPMSPSDTTPSTPALAGLPIRSYPANLTGCTDGGGFPPGTFTGAIAVVRRGATSEGGVACSFTEKSANAAAAGAIVAIIADNVVGVLSMTTPGATIPTYSIDMIPGDALLSFLADYEADAAGNIVPSAISHLQGDVLADFSYRGPTLGLYVDETKPDISAPGVNIYAALDDASGNYGLDSGTSMATPHITGSAALIRAVHPDWTPIEVGSALMTTATNATGTQEDAITPWTIDDVGSGRVDLTKAALAGLTLDESYSNFIAANPNGGSMNLRDLNMPEVRDVACSGHCTWTRTVRNRLDSPASWNASFQTESSDFTLTTMPASFTLAAGAQVTLTITATPVDNMMAIGFGNIVLRETQGRAPDQHLTVAVKGNAGDAVDEVFVDGFEVGAL